MRLKRGVGWGRRAALGRRWSAIAVLLVILVAGVGAYVALAPSSSAAPTCSGSPSPAFTSSTIKIGYLTEISGNGVSNGYAARIGAELAVNQTNAAGGVNGKTIDLEVMDDQTNPPTATQRAEALDSQGVLAITGPTDQADAVAVSSYAEACGVPFGASTVPSAAVVAPGSNWTVSVQPDAVQWGAAVAKYVSEAVPGAKIAMMTQNAEVQTEMAAGVRWYADTYKNESVVFDQLYANAQFPWATAAEAAKFSGANAVVVSWISSVGFSQSNVLTALLSAGFVQSQIFVVDATNQVPDLGVDATGISGATTFDSSVVDAPNASAFANEILPWLNATLHPKTYCGVCPTDIGPIYYYSYLGMEMMINAIQAATSNGQPLTRTSFMASMRHASIEDAYGNTVSIGPTGSAVGSLYIVAAGPLNSSQSIYPLELIKTVRFAPGLVPSYQLAKTA
jgi:ABC-type branched-subunit amino acid transport system substrate-binding protein